MISLNPFLKATITCLFLGISFVSEAQLTNDLIWGAKSPFREESVDRVNSMNDGEHYTALNYNKKEWTIDKYSFKSYDKIGTVLSSSDLKLDKAIRLQNYSFNDDETKLLLVTEITPIYRRSYTAIYYIHDLTTGKTELLIDKKVRHAEFSPDGDKVAYVFENNLYFKVLSSGNFVSITTDGGYNTIINGATDWVYEEEFAISKAYEWSANGRSIAFIRFDESEVKEFSMDIYGSLYPYQYTFKYPKAGEDNSGVEVMVFNTDNRHTYNLNVTQGRELYIPRINWTNDPKKLCVQTMNRHQNKLDYHIYTIDYKGAPQHSGNIKEDVVYSETSDTYIEIDDDLIFTPDNKSFIRTSEKDGYNHIYKIGFNGKTEQITSGAWDVIEFKGLSDNGKDIFYLSAEDGAMYQNLYKVALKDKKVVKLSKNQGKNDAIFSNGMKYYINYHSSANQPTYITLHNANGDELKVLEDNLELKTTLDSYKLPQKEFVRIPGSNGDLNGWMIKPKDFDPTKKYPIYMFVYGGPGHNTVIDQYEGKGYLWHCMMAQKGYVVVSVDPHGTMYRGAAFKKSTYMQLGKLETEDMIAAAKWLQTQDWVASDRIAVQGWSYGGYMSSLCMTKGAKTFKVGVAVAPVTNWKFYDSIYTERFMRTPKENNSGYDDNSPINHVEKLEGKYLLIHGSADDNVHMQNTMEMVNALVNANKPFDLFIYPNKNHSIYGGNTRLHLYNKITSFIDENL